MSGHSKWATNKRRKDAVDAKRAGAFTKLSKGISVAARNGGDPEMNFSLALAIEKAKAANMPKDNIEKAVKRGTGELAGATLEEVMYEGYGPGGVPLIIEGITDNKNRTTPEIKAILAKAGGSLGALHSVSWMFQRKGVVRITGAYRATDQQIATDTTDLSLVDRNSKDELILELLEKGAEDVQEEEGGLTVYTSFENFEKVRKYLTDKKLAIEYAEMEWVAKDKVAVEPEVMEKVQAVIDLLEENDDVGTVFTNMS